MTQIIYIDILFIVNLYIGYCLLMLTGILCKAKINRLRLLASSALQGLYSFIILLPVLPSAVSLPVKAAACALFTRTAFSVRSKKEFFRLYISFLCSGFCFAGIMLFVCLLTDTQRLTYKNTAVYFHIDIKVLAISTVICYAASRLIYVFIKRRTPQGFLYTLTVTLGEKSVSVQAVMDSGNTLTDAFSSLPVIIADCAMISAILPPGFDITDESTYTLLPGFRIVPYKTLNGCANMPAFRPSGIEIRNLSADLRTNDVIIGLYTGKIGKENTGALLNVRLLEEWSIQSNENKDHTKQTV